MKLYHGTSERHVAQILLHGLRPRGKAKGNWTHSIESCPTAVYLTQAYALHYALSATKKEERLAILEVESDLLPPWLFAPDEDWLEQVSRKATGDVAPLDKPMKYRTRWYRRRLLSYCHLWQESLDGLGNCTFHGPIPPSAITRVAYVDQDTNAELIMAAGLDPTITLINYKICGAKYRGSMQQLFGETVTEDDPFAGMRSDEEVAKRDAYLAGVWSKVQIEELRK